MQQQTEFPVVLHQNLLSENVETSICKTITDICLKIFLAFLFHIFPSAEDI